MSDLKQEPIVATQPTTQAQPSYQKYREQTGTQEWTSNIWDCFTGEDNLCLKAFCCSCFVYGKTAHRTRDPTMQGYDRFNADCLMFAAGNYCGLGWVLHFINRGEVRGKYAIKGDVVTDCLFSACCVCCSLIQVEKEVLAKSRAAGVQQGYQAPVGMSAAPQ